MPLKPLWFFLLCLNLGLFAAPPQAAPQTIPPAGAQTTPTSAVKPANKAELSLVSVSHKDHISATFPKEGALTEWLKPLLEECKAALSADKNPPLLLVQITLRPQADALIELSGKPALSPSFSKALLARLKPYEKQRSSIGELCLRLQSPLAGQSDALKAAEEFSPKLASAEAKNMAAFEAQDLAAKEKLCRAWALDYALPLISRGASNVHRSFEGVFKMGRLIALSDFSAPFDPEKLTYSNPDYWRGLTETVPGNHHVAVIPVLLYMANGELDKARQLLSRMIPLANPHTISGRLEAEAMNRLNSLNKTLSNRVNEGIALHDKGSFDKAIPIYQKVLADYPRSAWARYELFYSEIHKDGKLAALIQEGRVWPEAAREIYARDPLYSTQFSAKKGVDMGDMLARLQLKALPSKKNLKAEELYGCYTDSALKLGCHGFAAQLYWLIYKAKLSLIPPSDPKQAPTTLNQDAVLDRFLYCLHSLGQDSAVKSFKGDRTALFEKLDQELDSFRKQ